MGTVRAMRGSSLLGARYLATGAIVLIALAVSLIFYTGTQTSPLIFFGLAIVISVWVAGTRAGGLATVLSVIFMLFFFTGKFATFSTETITDTVILVLLGVGGVVVIAIEARRGAALQTVEAERQRLQVILENIPVGVVVAEAPTGKPLLVNETAKKITRFDFSLTDSFLRFADLQPFRVLNANGTPYTNESYPLVRALLKGETTREAMFHMQFPDGTRRVLEGTAAPLRDSKSSITAGILVFSDMTERHLNDERLNLLHRLAESLSQSLTPQEVARVSITQAIAAFGADAGTVTLLNDDETELSPLLAINYPPDLVQRWASFSVDLPVPMSRAVRERKVIWAGKDYQQVTTNKRHKSWIAAPLIADDEIIGGIGFSFVDERPFSDDECAFLQTLATHCAQALQRALLTVKLKENAAQEERKRLARDLHDEVSQSLFASSAIAESLQRTWKSEPDGIEQQVNDLVTLNRGALAEMRTLLLELRPESITRYKLPELLRHLIDAARARRPFDIDFDVPADLPLPMHVHIAFYRIAQESINNIVKHSAATRFSVSLKRDGTAVMLTVGDNGRGFDPDTQRIGLGMETMQERATAIGALVRVESQPDQGTRVYVTWDEEHPVTTSSDNRA